MPLDTALALMGFAFVMSVSPGPANFLLLASGANFGFARTLPLVFGVSLGFLSMVALVGLGLGQILKSHPLIGIAVKTACGLYVLWLAAKIARSRSLGSGESTEIGRPFSFAQAAMLQLFNPKAWTVAIIVTATYVEPGAPVKSLIALVLVFAAVNLPSISLWAASGTALRSFLAHGNRIAVFNIAMAILLVASMAPVLLAAAD
ncbi:lysine transporter LysE [Hoeflea sp. BAL378]|uniref:LysE family translocator n=1 Tax=Hoeflea sp. BAL378 TaxID=1547437 RepID=UPI0005138994|nr:LysE family translocator [Hoeflea sp. BAL378]KGF69342.1 lysine transporter LysE [Hoeflea sp. BAL378]